MDDKKSPLKHGQGFQCRCGRIAVYPEGRCDLCGVTYLLHTPPPLCGRCLCVNKHTQEEGKDGV